MKKNVKKEKKLPKFASDTERARLKCLENSCWVAIERDPHIDKLGKLELKGAINRAHLWRHLAGVTNFQ